MVLPEEDTKRIEVEEIVQAYLERTSNFRQEPGLTVLAKGALQSSVYRRGFTGYMLGNQGDAEFNNLFVRGLVKTVSVGDSIQDAIDTMEAGAGGIVQLDVGTFKPSSRLSVPSGVFLNGAGKGLTIIDFDGNAAGILYSGLQNSPAGQVSVSSITRVGNVATVTTS